MSQLRPRDVLTVALPKGGLAWKGVLKVALPMDGLALTVECSVPKVDWQKEHWVGSSMGSGWRKRRLHGQRRHHGRLVGRTIRLQPASG